MEVGLFIPCLVDRFAPEVGLATARLLELAGHQVFYDPRQTCCGQPAFNAGHREEAAHLARKFLKVLDSADYLVAPSGSCVSMVARHYGELPLTEKERDAWRQNRSRVFELAQFLYWTNTIEEISARWAGSVGVHHSCHFLREIPHGVEGFFALMDRVEGLDLVELPDSTTCCGFGGTFSSKLVDVSLNMGGDKVAHFLEAGVRDIVLADAGCLIHLRGIIQAQGLEDRLNIMHYSQLFTGDER